MKSPQEDVRLARRLNAQHGYRWIENIKTFNGEICRYARLVDQDVDGQWRWAYLLLLAPQWSWRELRLVLHDTVAFYHLYSPLDEERYTAELTRYLSLSNMTLEQMMQEQIDDRQMEAIL